MQRGFMQYHSANQRDGAVQADGNSFRHLVLYMIFLQLI